jgi:hypothetical protein
VLAFAKGIVKKVLASLEMCWRSKKELLKSDGKLRKMLAFARGAFKNVLSSLGKCWHSLKELLKKCWKA